VRVTLGTNRVLEFLPGRGIIEEMNTNVYS